jgi:hypothetical protein
MLRLLLGAYTNILAWTCSARLRTNLVHEDYLVRNMVYCVSADRLLFLIHASEDQDSTLFGIGPKTVRIQGEL